MFTSVLVFSALLSFEPMWVRWTDGQDLLLWLLFSSGARSKIMCDRRGQHPSGNWVLLKVRWTKKWWDHPHRSGGCVHLPVSVVSPLPDHTSDMWPAHMWSWFLVILLRYHASSGMRPLVQRRKRRVCCAGVKSFSSSLFTYVAWDIAGMAILLHFREQWWWITVLAVLKSTGAAICTVMWRHSSQ